VRESFRESEMVEASRSSSKASKASDRTGMSGSSSVPDEWEVVAGEVTDMSLSLSRGGQLGETGESSALGEDEGDEGWDEARREA
jgi:hypothetical protein